MPASITLSDLRYALPDGRVLFSDLNLSFVSERTGLVGRNGIGKSTLLKLLSGEQAPAAGVITVSGRLGVLRQSLAPGPEETLARLFGIEADLACLRRIEAGEGREADFAAADWTLEPRFAEAIARAGLTAGPETPLTALSGGQRTRAALAALVFAAPDFLLLDEPTNNLDRDGRAAVAEMLAGWRDGTGARRAARGGTPRILLGAMKRRAEASSGELDKLSARLTAEAEATAQAARDRIEVLQKITVKLPPSGLPQSRTVLVLRDVVAGYKGGEAILKGASMEVRGPERIALCGANGSGKSSLLRVIAGTLPPRAGEARVDVPFVLLDQDVRLLDPALTVLENFRRLNPDADENGCRAALARFRFRAEAALQPAGSLSGGEKLRAGLAAVLGRLRPPQLLILDEPTNHLDIASIEAVEAGLNAYDGALLVVSHDTAFLGRIRISRRMILRHGRIDPDTDQAAGTTICA
ncbi:MAG: ATP-binding cassette domain-containing protein [Hyphomonas sp.]|jgi:ATPase subunit of ABC transporter with duplicated ATPase domains